MTTRIAPGVVEIDTLLGGWPQTTAGYLLTGPQPVLVETGSQSSVPTLKAALAALGIGPEDLAGVALTHIHLDHAGGVGDIAAAFPRASIYVHELGARHLVDPRRLVASAALVYGELLDDLYGRLSPTPAERLCVLRDGERVDLGAGRSLVAIDSPGHAKHHLGFFDDGSGLVFAGDAAGVQLPGGGELRPATPPPDFDLDQALSSLLALARPKPARVCLAHYGLIDVAPDELFDAARERLVAWAEVATAAFRSGGDVEEALARAFGGREAQLDADARTRREVLNGIHSNAAGLRRWLEQADRPPRHTSGAA